MSSQLPAIALSRVMPIDFPRAKKFTNKGLTRKYIFQKGLRETMVVRLGVRGLQNCRGISKCSELGGMNWQVSVKPRLRIPDLKFVKRAWR
jgi:hypothetical protein